MQRYLNSDVLAERSQELFAQSPYMMALLDISKRLNDEIKHCCAYDKIKNTLSELGDYLKCHKSAAADTSSVPVVNEIEQRYIVRLQREYAPILNTRNRNDNIPALIRWCLKKDMPLQAVLFAIELLPDTCLTAESCKWKGKEFLLTARPETKTGAIGVFTS